MAKRLRKLAVVPPKVTTYPWVVVRVTQPSLGVYFSVIDAAQTKKAAEARANQEVTQKGGVVAVLQYRFVFAPQVVGQAPVAPKGLVAPPVSGTAAVIKDAYDEED